MVDLVKEVWHIIKKEITIAAYVVIVYLIISIGSCHRAIFSGKLAAMNDKVM